MADDTRLELVVRYTMQRMWADYLRIVEDMMAAGIFGDDVIKVAMSIAGSLYANACCRFLRPEGDVKADEVMIQQRQQYRDLTTRMREPPAGQA